MFYIKARNFDLLPRQIGIKRIDVGKSSVVIRRDSFVDIHLKRPIWIACCVTIAVYIVYKNAIFFSR